MKKIIIACAVFLLASGSAIADTVNLAIGEWAPYTSEKNPKGKLAEVLVREALELEGHQVKLSYYPWKRSYELVKNGEADGTFPWYSNDERKVEFHMNEEPLMHDKAAFFHLKTTAFEWAEFSDLKKYRVGGTIGYSHVKQLEDQGVTVSAVANEETNFKKMLAGRIDAYPASIVVGYEMINRLFSADKAALFTFHPKLLTEDAMFGLFSKHSAKGKEYSEALSRGLKKLRASGRYDEIYETYMTAN